MMNFFLETEIDKQNLFFSYEYTDKVVDFSP